MTAIDLKPVVDLFFTFVDGLILTVVLPTLAALIARKLHIDATSALAQRVVQVASNGAAYGLSQAQGAIDRNAMVDVKSPMVAAGVRYVESTVTAADLASLGVTPAHLEEMVAAQVQKLLGAPTVAPPAPASVVVVAPQPAH
jgi:hypothetical protein